MKQALMDMTGRQVEISFPPMRIVSLVPSQTELLYDLGLDKEVVGITKFCVHPKEWHKTKKRVGGTKTVHLDMVRSLQPDLVLANKEENTKEQIEELATLFPTWVSDIHTTDEALHMINEIGRLVNRAAPAENLIKETRQEFALLEQAPKNRKKVAYFIWRKPWMCAGGDTFISDMIKRMGWINALADMRRYPEIELEMIQGMNIDLILLSSEPYPFKDKHVAEIQAVLPGVEIMLVDGEMFSWYGSRMRAAAKYLRNLSS